MCVKKICFGFGLFFVLFSSVCAASITVTSNSNYVTSGGKVIFYVNIRDAGAWQLSGSGTGATSGCSLGEQGVGDTGTGRNGNKTLVVTCNATSVGQISFYVSGNVTDASSGKSVDVSGRKVVTVQAPREKDSNNYLKSIGVVGYSFTPEFSKDVMEYSVTVPSTVDKVMIEASPESSYATVSGTGEFEVDEGINTKEISVMSETGVERIYKVIIHVKDEHPISVQIDNQNYTILKNVKNIEKPELYEASTMKIQNFDIPIFVSDITGYTLVVLKDERGKTFFAIYDKEQDTYELYYEMKSHSLILNILKPEKEFEGYEKTELLIDDISYVAYQFRDSSDYAIAYAMNVETGEKDYYLYHKGSNTFQIYSDEVIESLREEILKHQSFIYLLFGVVGFFFFISMFALMKKPNQKKWKRITEDSEFASLDDVVEQIHEPISLEEDTPKETLEEPVLEDVTLESESMIDTFIEVPKTKKEKKKRKKKKQEEDVVPSITEEVVEEISESEDVMVTQIIPKESFTEDELSETVDVTEALKKMNDAEDIIREYEKTLSLSKDELRKAREKQEQEEKKEDAPVVEEISIEESEHLSKKKKRKKRKK